MRTISDSRSNLHKKRLVPRVSLFGVLILLLLLLSCGSRDGIISPTEWFDEMPTYYPSLTPVLPTATHTPPSAIKTDILSVSPSPTNSDEDICDFYINVRGYYGCYCGDRFLMDLPYSSLEIKKATQAGWCDIEMLEAGYKVVLQEDWFCALRGAYHFYHNDLECINQLSETFTIYSVYSELPIDIIEQTVLVISEGGNTAYIPVIGSREIIILKNIKLIQSKQTTRVLSEHDGSVFLRYFLKNGNRLYVLETEIESAEGSLALESVKFDTPEIAIYVDLFESIIASMLFTD